MEHLNKIHLPSIETEPVGDSTPPQCKVILTIFAGRKCYMECSRHYLEILLRKGFLSEVHLWDYTRNSEDSTYIKELVKEIPGFVYKTPLIRITNSWTEYYVYYANADYTPDTILIKCDDDVVYFDIEQFPKYLNAIKDDGLYYPNIINNDVCAYIQTKYGVHTIFQESDICPNYDGTNDNSLSGWAHGSSSQKAEQIHKEFLTNKSKFLIQAQPIQWKGRISINMFGGLFSNIQKYYSKFVDKETFDYNNDETFFSVGLYHESYVGENHASNIIVPFMNVVHFSFLTQDTPKLNKLFLESYQQLALSYKAKYTIEDS